MAGPLDSKRASNDISPKTAETRRDLAKEPKRGSNQRQSSKNPRGNAALHMNLQRDKARNRVQARRRTVERPVEIRTAVDPSPQRCSCFRLGTETPSGPPTIWQRGLPVMYPEAPAPSAGKLFPADPFVPPSASPCLHLRLSVSPPSQTRPGGRHSHIGGFRIGADAEMPPKPVYRTITATTPTIFGRHGGPSPRPRTNSNPVPTASNQVAIRFGGESGV